MVKPFRHCNRTAFTSRKCAQWFAYFMRQRGIEWWAESERCANCGYWHASRRLTRGVQAGYASLSEEQQNTPPHEKHSQYSGNPGNGPVIDLAGGASRFTTTSRSHAEPRGLY